MSSKLITHEIIRASAGTGKTFNLTGRLIKLLARGTAPEKIVALTFTRAAAGEIFDKLVTRLASAAADAETARTEAVINLQMPSLGQADFVTILRRIISCMHMIPIGTLDSFFVRIVRTFPYEFGISGDFVMLDDHALSVEREAIFRRLLAGGGDEQAQAARQAFLEAFKRATFGKEEKKLRDLLDEFIDKFHNLLLRAGEVESWGGEHRIWPAGSVWFDADGRASPQIEAKKLADLLANLTLQDRQRQKWDAFLSMAGCFTPHSILSKPGQEIFTKLLGQLDNLKRGNAVITVYKAVELTPAMCEHAFNLVCHIVSCIFMSRMQSTAGLYQILQQYEAAYQSCVRNKGKLTFADVAYLLTRNLDEDDGVRLSSLPFPGTDRLSIDYRLDGSYDHWAIDEFQDTSRRQWAAIQNLIDEVIQDSSGNRTFFAVGDVKQAIYGWRGGDSELLGDIQQHYGIHESTLSKSWRSCPEVIHTVNTVFAQLEKVDRLPHDVLARWQGVWANHETARSDLSGYAAMFEVRPGEERRQVKSQDWQEAIASLLEDVAPWRQGFTTAVLVRSNSSGSEISSYLRSRRIPAVWEGDSGIADNPVVAGFLSLLRVAEHPGDTFAWEHLRMTPFREFCDSPSQTLKGGLALEVLRDIYDHGFAFLVEKWEERLSTVVTLDRFSCSRLQEMLSAAQEFDRTGNKSCLDFVFFVESFKVSDLAAKGSVRVMTMHKCKGLDFDLVLLPMMPGRSGIDSVKSEAMLVEPRRDGNLGVDWLLHAPPKEVAMADDILGPNLERTAMRVCYEELCILYVAMTRARQGLYMIVPPAPKNEETAAIHLHTVLRKTLFVGDGHVQGVGPGSLKDSCLYEYGQRDWYKAGSKTDGAAEAKSQPDVAVIGHPDLDSAELKHHKRRMPSHLETHSISAADLFSLGLQRGREFGTALHALFQELEWIDSEPLDAVVQRWRKKRSYTPQLVENVSRLFQRALQNDPVREALRRPLGGIVTLWREKSFELVLDGEWISGTFDRVVIVRDERNCVRHAQILDFKSDRVQCKEEVATVAEKHASQMSLYRQVLSRLLQTGVENIDASLVFTHCGKVVAC